MHATTIAGDGRCANQRLHVTSCSRTARRQAWISGVSILKGVAAALRRPGRREPTRSTRPARRPVRRLTWRSSRSSRRRFARARICGYRSRRSLTTMHTGASGARRLRAFARTSATPSTYAWIASRPTPRAGRPSSSARRSCEAEQLVGVAMLLVVVDQARVRRRRDDGVERPAELELAARRRDARRHRPRRHGRQRSSRSGRACRACTAGETGAPPRRADTSAGACGTSTARAAARAGSRGRSGSCAGPSGRPARGRRAGRRPRRSRRRATGSGEARRRPAARTRHARTARPRPGTRSSGSNAEACSCAQIRSRRIASRLWRRVLTRMSRQLKPATSTPTASCPDSSALDERRPGAGERVEHATARSDVSVEQRLDELRHELAEVRMQAMDVLRPLPLGQLGLRPRQREVEPAVERLLRGRHGRLFGAHGQLSLRRELGDGGLQPARRVERQRDARSGPGSADASRRAPTCRGPRAGSRCRATPSPG